MRLKKFRQQERIYSFHNIEKTLTLHIQLLYNVDCPKNLPYKMP